MSTDTTTSNDTRVYTNAADLTLTGLKDRLDVDIVDTFDVYSPSDIYRITTDNDDYPELASTRTLVRCGQYDLAILDAPFDTVIESLPVPTSDDLDAIFKYGPMLTSRIESIDDHGMITWERDAFDPTNPRTLYKVVRPDGSPNYGGEGMTYDLPTFDDVTGEWTPGAWTMVHANLELCENGIHVTTNPAKWRQNIDDRVYAVEVLGVMTNRKDGTDDKLVAMTCRLVRDVTPLMGVFLDRQHDEETKRNRLMSLTSAARYATNAAMNGRVYFAEHVDPLQLVTAIQSSFSCPHCHTGPGRWYVRETRTQSATTFFVKDRYTGSPQVTHLDSKTSPYGDERTFTYSCCGHNLDANDFCDKIAFGHPYRSTFARTARDVFDELQGDRARKAADAEAETRKHDLEARQRNTDIAVQQAREQTRRELLALIQETASAGTDVDAQESDTELPD